MNVLIGVAAFIAGIVITAVILFAVQRADYNRRREKRRAAAAMPAPKLAESEKESRKPFEFSKTVLAFVMLTYFVGLGFGIYAVNKILLDYPEYAIQALIAIFGYVGTPISIAIGFYSWKAKAENTLKIMRRNPKQTEGVTVDPSAIM